MQTPITALLGPAGTGKTYAIREKLKKDARFAKLCATTGIAAINLADGMTGESISTLSSTLKFFDLESLRENYEKGMLGRVLRNLRAGYKNLAIDECSMLGAEELDILIEALDSVNAMISEEMGEKAFGLILIGDFLQLPPVKGEYCFKAQHWPRVKVKKLTEIKRQTDPKFVELLQYARCGDGEEVGRLLEEYGCLRGSIDKTSDCTTIYATNAEVDTENNRRLGAHIGPYGKEVCGKKYTQEEILITKKTYQSFSHGVQRSDWKTIPKEIDLYEGLYVMILANEPENFSYANGDCGWIMKTEANRVLVMLKRSGEMVSVPRITRLNTVSTTPEGYEIPPCMTMKEWREAENKQGDAVTLKPLYEAYLREMTDRNRNAASMGEPYYDHLTEKWIIGRMTYLPIRLAYASTVHKAQGLTLDQVQIVPSHKFFGADNMFYVALSRARSLEGLTVVGTKEEVAKRCNTTIKLKPWI